MFPLIPVVPIRPREPSLTFRTGTGGNTVGTEVALDADLMRWQDDGGREPPEDDEDDVWYLTYDQLRRMF